MLASDFAPPRSPSFPTWVRYASYVPLYGIALPLAKIFEAAGLCPNLLGRRLNANIPGFGDYRPSPHDVIVCSYFKSGTTWLLQMATQIAFRGQAKFENIHHVVPWPDNPMPLVARLTIPLSDPSPLTRSPTGLRVIKTHLLRSGIPFVAEARYIAATRDPKDVCVSGYYFLKALAFGPLMPSVDRWIDHMFSANFQVSWAEHLASYWPVRDEPNVLFFTYEEIGRDRPSAVRRAAEFMGVDLSAEEFDSVVLLSSFDYMKNEDGRFEPVIGRILPWSYAHTMRRSGKSGGSSELLTPSQQQRIDNYCRAELKRLGCDFSYDEAFRIA